LKTITLQKYAYIDALRAFAIMGVVLLHTSQWITPSSGIFQGIARMGGYGVQLFFIASSLALFLSMQARSQRETHAVLGFFIRRFFRIAPMFYLGIVAYLLYNSASQERLEQIGAWWHVIVTALFLHGWCPETINLIVPGDWSIAAEMSFYIFVPVLFSILNNLKRSLYFLFISVVAGKLLAVIVVRSLLFISPPSQSYSIHVFSYYWFFSQLPVFILGICLFHVLCREQNKRNKSLGLFLLLVSMFLFIAFINYSCWGDLIPQHLAYAGAFCIFAAALHWYPHWIFVNFLTKAIGKISFSLYLSHFMLLNLFKSSFHGRFLFHGDFATGFAFLIVLGASAAVSTVLYFAVEKPGINFGKYLIRRL